MRSWFSYSVGFISACFLLVACASFPYKWGVLNLEEYRVQYKDADATLDICKKNAQGEFTCVLIKIDEFFKLKEDYEQCKNK